MTWTTPMTAVSGEVLSAAQFNTYIRDNLNETAVARTTSAGNYFTSDGSNNLNVRRVNSLIDSAVIEVEAAATAGWISNGGPSVACSTGSSALVFLTCHMAHETANLKSGVGYRVTGATSLPLTTATDFDRSMVIDGLNAGTGAENAIRLTTVFLEDGLNSGTNIFEMQYWQHSSGSTFYVHREIIVMPL